VQRTPSLGFAITVEGEMGVAGFLVNLFKKCGRPVACVALQQETCSVSGCVGVKGLGGLGSPNGDVSLRPLV